MARSLRPGIAPGLAPAAALCLVLAAALAGCRAEPPPATPAPPPPPEEPAPVAPPAPPRAALTPLGFDDFVVTPAETRATERFEARARLMPGVSPYTDVTYVWSVDGRPIPNWSREFLRHAEGRWRRGDVVSVYAVAEDGTGRRARTETLSVRLGEVASAERPPTRPPIDWDALRAEDRRRAEERGPRTAPVDEPAPPDPGRYGFYVNPQFGPRTDTVVILPRPRRGVTTGPEQRVDGYSPGEPRVDGYSPGEPRVDGYSPGEPRVNGYSPNDLD